MSKSLDEETLKAAGIEFFVEVSDPKTIFKECSRAEQLVTYLLRFRNLMTAKTFEELKPINRELNQLSKEEVRTLVTRSKQCDRSKTKALQSALEMKKGAKRIVSKEESRWSEVIEDKFFGRLRENARNQEGQSRYTASGALARYRVESEHTWQFGARILDQYCLKKKEKAYQRERFWDKKEVGDIMTAPKPDLFFAFHAYKEYTSEGGPLSIDDNIHNFTITELCRNNEIYEKLATKTWKQGKRPFGFYPSPCKQFYGVKATSYKDSYCFPWSVAEWKHHGKIGTREETSKLFCQAANGAAVCLTLFACAASGGQPGDFLSDIRPVVYFTFTGHVARVWIGYITEIRRGCFKYRMRCMWQGSLFNVIDNIKLCLILERLHFWAMNYLRPWLSGCIDQWRRSSQLIKDEQAYDGEHEKEDSDEDNGGYFGTDDDNISIDGALARAMTLNFVVEESDEDDGEGEYVPGDDTDGSGSDEETEGYGSEENYYY